MYGVAGIGDELRRESIMNISSLMMLNIMVWTQYTSSQRLPALYCVVSESNIPAAVHSSGIGDELGRGSILKSSLMILNMVQTEYTSSQSSPALYCVVSVFNIPAAVHSSGIGDELRRRSIIKSSLMMLNMVWTEYTSSQRSPALYCVVSESNIPARSSFIGNRWCVKKSWMRRSGRIAAAYENLSIEMFVQTFRIKLLFIEKEK